MWGTNHGSWRLILTFYTFIGNLKVYIGITSKGLSARWKEHLYSAEHDCPFKLHRAIRKYGKENFSVELIDFANSWEELTKKEQQYISEYNSLQDEFGYNMTGSIWRN